MRALGLTMTVAAFGLAAAACGTTSDSLTNGQHDAPGSSFDGAGAAGGDDGVGAGGSGSFGGGSGDGDGDGDGDTGAGGSGPGCRKVDFLFVIDNSSSMANQQAALIQSFPGFIAAIDAAVPGGDYHVMVTDTDGCAGDDCAAGATCDERIGAGVVHPTGAHSSDEACTFGAGRRYLVQGDPDLEGTFACAAQVGTAGSSAERPMDSIVATMGALNDAGACNAGFLRDDAILVVTFISDDPHYVDRGTPDDWFAAVTAAKHGDASAVVVLGLTPNFADCDPGKAPPKGAHWSQFVAMFGTHGLEADVCSSDYAPFFQKAVGTVADTCKSFDPPR